MTSTQGTGLAGRLRLHGWRHPAILGAAALSVFAGFAQFASTAALPDVAVAFGHGTDPVPGAPLVAQVGMSATALGIGLATIRMASLAALPLSRVADRRSRRGALLGCTAVGLVLTAVAAVSPSFWWFVALFALGRPALSAANGVAGVVAAEETTAADRAKAVALLTAAYGTGAGIPVIVRGVADAVGADVSFRAIFAGALVPLALLPFVARAVEEPERHRRLREDAPEATAVRQRLGRVPAAFRQRLAVLCGLTFALTFATGPVNTYLFVYAENVLGLPASVLAVVIAPAALLGVVGLLVGRWAADRIGRRWTAAVTHVGVAAAGWLTYGAGRPGAIAGYLASLLVASAYAPAGITLGTEIFPTSTRATAAGWVTVSGTLGATAGLLAFGVLAEALDSFGGAAGAIAIPVAAAAVAYRWLPETRGLELEESAPEAPAAPG